MGGHACPWHCLPARPPVHEPVPGVRWVHGYSFPFLHRRLRPHLRVLSAGDGEERDPSLLHLQHWWRRHLESCHRLNQEGHRRYYQRSVTVFGVEVLSVTLFSSNLRGSEIKGGWRMTSNSFSSAAGTGKHHTPCISLISMTDTARWPAGAGAGGVWRGVFKSAAVSSSKCSVCHGHCLLECTEFSVNDEAVGDGNFQKMIKQMSATARPSMLCRADWAGLVDQLHPCVSCSLVLVWDRGFVPLSVSHLAVSFSSVQLYQSLQCELWSRLKFRSCPSLSHRWSQIHLMNPLPGCSVMTFIFVWLFHMDVGACAGVSWLYKGHQNVFDVPCPLGLCVLLVVIVKSTV